VNSAAVQSSTASEGGQSLGFRPDALAFGLIFMLLANVLQRGIGFARNFGFCRLLPEDQLGMWSLSNSFFLLAAPVATLGLAGSLARFAEPYRRHGQLWLLARRSMYASSIGLGLWLSLLVLTPEPFSRFVFGTSLDFRSLVAIGLALAMVLTFNFVTELLNGLRQVRTVSTMQLVQSLSFTSLGLGWLWAGGDWRHIVLAYALATLVALVPGAVTLLRGCRAAFTPSVSASLSPAALDWSRVLRYAASLWVMNIVGNLFDIVDRYMLLHLSGELVGGQYNVGQLYSGQLLSTLFLSLGGMLGSMLLPYMTADWESGNRLRAASSARLGVKLTSLLLTMGGCLALVGSPWLYQVWLGDRFQQGEAILGLALMQAIWMALISVSQSYLWCAERGRPIALLTVAALLVNLWLNGWWVPTLGVSGAMLATTLSTGGLLVSTWCLLERSGCVISPSVTFALALPSVLVVGTAWSLGVLVAVLLTLLVRPRWCLHSDEAELLVAGLEPIRRRLRAGR
jgi:polysaccharide transporter, PST family